MKQYIIKPEQRIQPVLKTEKAEGTGANPLGNIICKIGDKSCATRHVNTIQQARLFHPMNEKQRVQLLTGLQQQHGNRFVQRVVIQYTNQPINVHNRSSFTFIQRQLESNEDPMDDPRMHPSGASKAIKWVCPRYETMK